jgi:hypothetical protein
MNIKKTFRVQVQASRYQKLPVPAGTGFTGLCKSELSQIYQPSNEEEATQEYQPTNIPKLRFPATL